MLVLSYFFIFVAAIILQLTVIPLFSVQEVAPNLILIAVISVTLLRGKVVGIMCGFFAGVCFDFFGTGFIGISSLTNTLAAFIAGFWAGEQFDRRITIILGPLFASIFVHDFFYYNILRIGASVGFGKTLLSHIFPNTIYTLVFMMMIYMLLPKSPLGRR